MKKTPEKIYSSIDNGIYNTEGDRWWDSDFSLSLIRILNPVRVGFAERAIGFGIKTPPKETRLLEVGCGGGILSEEFSKMGYQVTGIDPAEQSLNTAIAHAAENNLNINYHLGSGENLPFPDASYDVVLCCDVLEHVKDLSKVIAEVSRILKPGGMFIYDTFNRTFLSKLVVIKIMQEWSRWAIMPPGLHVWEMFIKPSEMKELFSENRLSCKGNFGFKPDVSYLTMLRLLRKRANGDLTYEEFGSKFHMVRSPGTQVIYMGFAIRNF